MVLYKQLVFIKNHFSLYGGNKNYETMNAKVKVLRNVLQSVIDDIDDGKYDRTDAEIDAAVCEFVNDGAKSACFSEVVYLLSEFEFVNDVLHIFAIAVEVFDEIHLQA